MNIRPSNLFFTIIFLSVLAALILGYNIGIAYGETEIQIQTIPKSYGDMLVIRGFDFTVGSEYKVSMVMPNDLIVILDDGLVRSDGKVGLTHPIEDDALNGNYEIIIETEFEKSSIIFNKNIEFTTEEKEEIINDVPYGGNVAPLIEPKIVQEQEPILQKETITSEIPSWVRGLFEMWTLKQISDSELVNGIKYLVQIGVIQL